MLTKSINAAIYGLFFSIGVLYAADSVNGFPARNPFLVG